MGEFHLTDLLGFASIKKRRYKNQLILDSK